MRGHSSRGEGEVSWGWDDYTEAGRADGAIREAGRSEGGQGYALHNLNESCIAMMIVKKDESVEWGVEEFWEVLRIRIMYQLKRRRLYQLGRKDLLRKYRRREWRRLGVCCMKFQSG